MYFLEGIVVAVAAELLRLALFLGIAPLAQLLGGAPPPTVGWACVFGCQHGDLTDAAHKSFVAVDFRLKINRACA